MSSPWSSACLVKCLRDLLGKPGVLSEHASLVGVSERRGSAVVSFRWMKDVHVFAVEFSLRDAAEGVSTGLPMESPEQWADEVGWWLMEALDTGFVGRASRRRGDDAIVLSRPTCGPGFRIVGHAVVSWLGGATASVDVCQTLAGAPGSVSLGLARTAVHDAADAGAEQVVTGVAVPHLELLGFRPQADGSLVVDTGFWDEDLEGARALLHQARSEPIPPSWTTRPGPGERWITVVSHEPPSMSVDESDG